MLGLKNQSWVIKTTNNDQTTCDIFLQDTFQLSDQVPLLDLYDFAKREVFIHIA